MTHNESPSKADNELDWEKLLGVPKPKMCNLMAACCSVATPSVGADELLKQGAAGDETSRDFLSVFIPHESHEAAKAFYHIDRMLAIVRSRKTRQGLAEKDIVFYHCRFLGEDRRCQIYEDRPTFCRKYPASPMSILVKGCGYEPWVDSCKKSLLQLGYEIVPEGE